jgi:hypothetical protein
MPTRRAPWLPALLIAVIASSSKAQDQGHPAHPTEKLGTVHFQTSCRTQVAPEFDHAIALLHSFEFPQAIRGFESVIASDSSCAIAYWGIALSLWTNPFAVGARSTSQLESGRRVLERGLRVAPNASEREKDYLGAVGQLYRDYEHTTQAARVAAYTQSMEALAARYPDDTEASIFYALALTASAPPTDKTYANQLKAAAILERLYASQPDHPGLTHYMIHTFDVPPLASRGLDAANRYATIAPSAAHALHMPSHIFTRVGEWDESIATNLRSIESARRERSLAEALHASDYAMYAYLQEGQDRAARQLMDGLPTLKSSFDPTATSGGATGTVGAFALAAIPARYALERRSWQDAAALAPGSSAFPWTEALDHFARALGAARLGDLAKAHESVDSLGAIQLRLVTRGETYWAEQVAIEKLGAEAWLALAERRESDALALMREASAREDKTEKSAVTPGPLAPARELLGDMYLELHRPAEALDAYQATLKKEPKRFRSLYGAMRAASLSGDRSAALGYARQLRETAAKGDPESRPELREAMAIH